MLYVCMHVDVTTIVVQIHNTNSDPRNYGYKSQKVHSKDNFQ